MLITELIPRLVLPPKCGGCGERIDIFKNDKIDAFCPECRRRWEMAKMSICAKCDRENCSCICDTKYLKDTRVLTLVKFGVGGCSDRFVYRLKQRPVNRYFDFAAAELYKRLKREAALTGEDLSKAIYINVPRIPWNRRQFGFDHASKLAKRVAALAGGEFLPVLERAKGGRSQKKIKGADRYKNVKGSFYVDLTEGFMGATVILIDDIITTGATANECIRELKKSGCSDVIVLALARAASKKDIEKAERRR